MNIYNCINYNCFNRHVSYVLDNNGNFPKVAPEKIPN